MFVFRQNRQIGGGYSSDCQMEKVSFISKISKFTKSFLAIFVIFSLIVASFSPEIMAQSKKKKTHRSASGKSGKSAGKSNKRSASGKSGKTAGKSNKRSASGKSGKTAGKSNKRSASGKSGLRSASGTSGLRAGGRNSKRASATGRSSLRALKGSSNGGTGATITAKSVSNPCVLNKALWKATNDNGDSVYYSSKTKMCNMPLNTKENTWTEAVSEEIKKLTWLKKNEENTELSGEVVYFTCEDGFLTQGNGAKATCMDPSSICPLNSFVELVSKDKYTSLDTGEECSIPANSSVKKATAEDAEEWGVESNAKLFSVGCKAGYHSSSIDGNIIQCSKCEEGYTSEWGSTLCSETCEANEIHDSTGKCQPCNANATFAEDKCVCNPGYVGDGLDCQPCPAGSFCTGGTREDGTLQICPENTYSVAGAGECTACPEGTTGTSTRDTCLCTGNAKFRSVDNSCVSTQCKEGEVFDNKTLSCQVCKNGTFADIDANGNEVCSPCPVGSMCKNGKKTICPAGKYTDTTGKSSCDSCPAGYACSGGSAMKKCEAGRYAAGGNSICANCPEYYWSDAGASTCNPIMIKITYSHWDSGVNKDCNMANSAWFYAGNNFTCNNSTFGDPAIGKGKSCGGKCSHFLSENHTMGLDCKTLPCILSGNGGSRYIRLRPDGKYETKGDGWSNNWVLNNDIMVKWDNSETNVKGSKTKTNLNATFTKTHKSGSNYYYSCYCGSTLKSSGTCSTVFLNTCKMRELACKC